MLKSTRSAVVEDPRVGTQMISFRAGSLEEFLAKHQRATDTSLSMTAKRLLADKICELESENE